MTIKKTRETKSIKSKSERPSSRIKYIILLLIVLLSISIVAGSAYYYLNVYDKDFKSTEDETRFYVEKVAKVMQLPEGEVILATVSDINQLNDQVFFKDAVNGDKVLIFPQQERAILYRPETELIIHAGPINYLDSQEEATGSDVAKEAEVLILNGTGAPGVAADVSEKLSQIDGYKLNIDIGNANKTDYTEGIVVVNDSKLDGLGSQIAELLNISSGKLPDDEKPNTDIGIIIIVGKE